MAPLLKKLSTLEVEPLQIVENAPESEQERYLDTLTSQTEITILSTLNSKFPVNEAKCCCCPCCCCNEHCCCCC
jgi:hypothetical protein